ncbi:MAG: transferrin-binding protein-like solute binding protein [Pseudomonadota bacterium]
MRRTSAIVAAGLSTTLLAACSSSGGSGGGGGGNTTSSVTPPGATVVTPPIVTPPTGTTTTPPPTARPTGGTTVQNTLASGAIVLVDPDQTAAIEGTRMGCCRAATAPEMQVRNNFLGGLDVSIKGELFYLKSADANADSASWSQTIPHNGTRRQTLTLWNAGKGGRNGLFQEEEGQRYHKVLGFHHADGYGNTVHGHSIIGEATSTQNMGLLSRQASYNGYYYANVSPASGGGVRNGSYVTGQMDMTADFDMGTVSGSANDVLVRNPGSLGAIDYGDTMTFAGTIAGSDIQGQMTSSLNALNGAEMDGAFYGNGAQEAAGAISNDGAWGAADGYFTVADPTAN